MNQIPVEHMVAFLSNIPRLSIGMPVYNGGAYIGEAIQSLLAQTVDDFELVISDNASTDGTSVICQNFALRDSRVRYIRQPVNLGVANNYRLVLHAAQSSEYFMWAACDDLWSPNWVEKLIECFGPSDIGLFGGYREGSGALVYPPTYSRDSHWRFFLDSDRTGKCLYSYSIFRREVLINSKFDYFDCPVGADQVYLLHLVAQGDLRCVPGGVLSYRVHSASVSAQQSGARNRLRTVLSRYPFAYYRMAFEAVPCRLRFAMPFLICWKYAKEQTPLAMGLLRSMIRRAILMLKG